ncbi:hypothetical protein HDC93_006591 [Streptomyces sp. AK010]|nr:hypothetical protein [Streptomyces sp. AK010]
MPMLVKQVVLAGEEREVPLARRKAVDKVCAWGVPLNGETADPIRRVASELITSAVVHGEGPVTVTLYHRLGRPVIDVVDDNSAISQRSCAQADDETGRGLALVELLVRGVRGSPLAAGSAHGRSPSPGSPPSTRCGTGTTAGMRRVLALVRT